MTSVRHSSSLRPLLAALTVAASVAVGGCAAAGDPDAATGAPTGSGLSGELTVYAAASLGGAFDEIAARFAERHPGLEVRPIVYDGSTTLSTQIVAGAPADVFAAADEAAMGVVVDAGLASTPTVFATNTLVIAVPSGNPAGVTALEDLARPATTVVLCAPEVPCGAASRRLLARQSVDVSPASVEQNVTAVLTKVASAEADAGLVYATDIARARGVRAVAAEGADQVVSRYPIATLADAGNPAAAAAFEDFVTGPEGRRVLADAGFGAP
jgi:molybdate transport system substrate-binding protein